jgi:hypothetical protein
MQCILPRGIRNQNIELKRGYETHLERMVQRWYNDGKVIGTIRRAH